MFSKVALRTSASRILPVFTPALGATDSVTTSASSLLVILAAVVAATLTVVIALISSPS